jgi:hypothetical protein
MKDMRIAAVSYQPVHAISAASQEGRLAAVEAAMYVISSRNTALQGAATSSWLSAVGGVVRSRYSDWAARRREMAVARALYYATDVELRDMGINRGDIAAIVSGNYRRD